MQGVFFRWAALSREPLKIPLKKKILEIPHFSCPGSKVVRPLRKGFTSLPGFAAVTWLGQRDSTCNLPTRLQVASPSPTARNASGSGGFLFPVRMDDPTVTFGAGHFLVGVFLCHPSEKNMLVNQIGPFHQILGMKTQKLLETTT